MRKFGSNYTCLSKVLSSKFFHKLQIRFTRRIIINIFIIIDRIQLPCYIFGAVIRIAMLRWCLK